MVDAFEPEKPLEVVIPTTPEILTPNQKEDKDNLKKERKDIQSLLENMEELLREMKEVKAHLAIMTGEKDLL